MKPKHIKNIIFTAIILVYLVYAAVFIYQSSFIVDGERYFVLFDDAMISMRYARNLAHGDGLVWNAGGERVEGYTNPLWVVYMAVFHLFTDNSVKISLLIQVSGALFFVASFFFIKKIGEEISQSAVVPLLAVFLTAFYGQLSTWSLLGMEVSGLILITCVAAWMGLRMMKNAGFSAWLYVLLGISTLVRLDMVVIYLAILVFLAVADSSNRRRHLIWGLGTLAIVIIGQTLFRLAYYGDPLPNTYYLKVTGAPLLLMLKRGVFVLFKFAWNFNIALFILPFAVILVRREKSTLFLAWIFLSMCAYSVYVGGDAWESKGGANRFISTVMPLFFLLFAYALEILRQALVQFSRPTGIREKWLEGLSIAGVVAFAFVGLINFNALLDTSSLKYWVLLERHPFVPGSERYVRISRVVGEITTDQATVAVVTAGIIPYFTDRPSIDLLGKSDPRIAHGEMHNPADLPLIDFRPGHMKWDYAYSLGELKPDIVAQLWDGYDNPDTLQYLSDYTKVEIEGFPFFLKNGSPYVRWEKIEK